MTQEEIIENKSMEYALKQGVNYPLADQYKYMITSQISAAYKAGIKEAISNPGKYGLQPVNNLTDSLKEVWDNEEDKHWEEKSNSKELVEANELANALEKILEIQSEEHNLGLNPLAMIYEINIIANEALAKYNTNYKNNSPKELDSDAPKFAEWIYTEGWRNYDSFETWINGMEVLNTTQLYERFLKLRNLG